jgi:hypothetical protein
MRTIHLATFVMGAIALTAGNAAAQTSPILNIVEVQKLVSSETPADHDRLEVHFTALAEQSAQEAKRHQTMARSFGGNPSRQIGTNMTVHCNRLAELNTQAASTLRELAAHHNKLAVGTQSTVPPKGVPYQSGKGARVPTDKDLSDLAAKATTRADHRALMEYFQTTAKRHAAAANEYTRLEQTYRGTRIAVAGLNATHLARLAREAEKEANAAANMHEDLAGVAR